MAYGCASVPEFQSMRDTISVNVLCSTASVTAVKLLSPQAAQLCSDVLKSNVDVFLKIVDLLNVEVHSECVHMAMPHEAPSASSRISFQHAIAEIGTILEW
jgi:hypothetical protein